MVVVKVFYVSITLFADACSADASDAYEFNSAGKYIENKNFRESKIVTDFLKKWITMNTDLIHLSAAPLIQPVLPMSNNLSTISKQLLLAIEENKIKKSIECVIGTIPIRNSADVELAV
jgi:hexosaminidase